MRLVVCTRRAHDVQCTRRLDTRSARCLHVHTPQNATKNLICAACVCSCVCTILHARHNRLGNPDCNTKQNMPLAHCVCAVRTLAQAFSWGGISASIPRHIPSDTTLCSLNGGALCEFPNPSFPCHRPDLPACTPILCHSQKQRATSTSKNRLLQQWARRHHCVMLSVRDSSPHSVQVRPYKIQRRQHR